MSGSGRQGSLRSVGFRQVDVFSVDPLRGNPVAVVADADGVDDETMAAFARWTNLSETTFILSPTTPEADYRLRIFTPSGELPFAGHPTLGSAHAWLEQGGRPNDPSRIVQECEAGLVTLRRDRDRLYFAAPPLVRSGPVDQYEVDAVTRALGIDPSHLLDAAWVDNGPGWLGLLLDDPAAVLALRPDFATLGANVGVLARYDDPMAAGADVEVRAFCPLEAVPEDPVTGSLNAGLAQWLSGRVLPAEYVAAQGTVLQRTGRVHIITDDAGAIWVGGATSTVIEGTVVLPLRGAAATTDEECQRG